MEIIFLGTGSSTGTPVIGCDCSTCRSTNPKNRRTRCSAAVVADDGAVFLIDTGPDLRLQALREDLLRVDGVFYTHTHADHLNGIDDLRNFCSLQQSVIPIYGNEMTINNIRQRFSYAFAPPSGHWDKPVLSSNILDQPTTAHGVRITPIPIMHGRMPILGYRFNDVAYITDVSEIPESSFPLLANLDILLLDCLHYVPHPTHINLDQALEYARKINAKTTYLIHMTHRIDYDELEPKLPAGITLAYDGLRVATPARMRNAS